MVQGCFVLTIDRGTLDRVSCLVLDSGTVDDVHFKFRKSQMPLYPSESVMLSWDSETGSLQIIMQKRSGHYNR